MSEWLVELRGALDREFVGKPRVCTLATIDDGWPRARSVVCRAITDAGQIWIASDRRSQKNAQLRRSPRSELVFWLPTLRLQFRLKGETTIADRDAAESRKVWSELSDAARALFFWPAPMSPLSPGETPPREISLDRASAPPESFEVLVLTPTFVDRLDLNAHPHARRQWDLDGSGWRGADVNP